jgi:hypothetical protein
MTRPGDRLYRLAMRLCDERSRRRLIDPAVADLQAEFTVAQRDGSAWRALRVLVTGYLSIVKVLFFAAAGSLLAEARTWQPEERAGARRGALVAVLTTILATWLLVTLFVEQLLPIPRTWLVYLVPSMLTVSLPLGTLLGAAWSLHGGARTRKMGAAIVAAAILCSIAMFANIAWVVPDSNQAFRQRAIAREQGRKTVAPVARGLHELSMPALRTRIAEELNAGRPHRARVAESVYYQRFAMAGATLPMHGVIVALALRRRWNRGRLIAAALVSFAVYYTALTGSRSLSEALAIEPVVAAWAGPALLAGTALLLTSLRPRARA